MKTQKKEAIVVPIILAGGRGRRLWPISTLNRPKALCKIPNVNNTLFEKTYRTLYYDMHLNFTSPIITCNVNSWNKIYKKYKEISYSNNSSFIIEPFSRNTAPSIGLACLEAKRLYKNKNVIVVVMPIDHVMKFDASVSVLERALKRACYSAAFDNSIVALGYKPHKISTKYGYMKCKKCDNNSKIYDIDRFVEKSSPNFTDPFCNSGIYVFKPNVYLNEFKKLNSKMYETVVSAFVNSCIYEKLDLSKNGATDNKETATRNSFIYPPKMIYLDIPNTESSIDYVIMEKTIKGKMVEISDDWDDLGTWNSIYDFNRDDEHEDDNHNVSIVSESTSVHYIHSKSNLVYSEDKELQISIVGLDNIIVVRNGKRLLISDRNKCDDYIENVSKHFDGCL